ncbi:hypothetical protein P4O66_002186 [Electrophorus voltai]|uniref:Immunoglobulin V-set domain-containing protein n=1 Tax=Electrophorus voltai TaxID=2609070 RepID=A0AAD8Z2F6_9TELE|nr:hypothetical protein P4O66_002186 [Electrophorus voltai]
MFETQKTYLCNQNMWSFWVLSLLLIVMDSCAVKLDSIQLKHGFQLSFKLLKEAQSLEFSALNGKVQYTIWSSSVKPKKGQVTGWGNDKRFIIKSVTFDDQGNYTQKSLKRTVLVNVKVKVVPSVIGKECVAGETLKISLRGLTSRQATLDFYSHDLNLTLVDHGLPIGKSHPNYYERLKVTTETIEVLNVNVSDMGNYTLQDDRGRKVLMVIMKLVDHHEKKLNPLVALMLLLGIPAGVCCCCRKRIFKKSGHPTTTTIVQSGNPIPPPGPPPSYNTVVDPAVPGLLYTWFVNPSCLMAINTPTYPAPGDSKVYPPPNPAFAPQPYYGGQHAMPPNLSLLKDLEQGISSEYSHNNPAYPPAVPEFPPGQLSQCSAASSIPPAPAVWNRIYKKSGHPTTTTNVQSGNLIPPLGPPPSYNTVVVPAIPGPINTPTYPAPGDSKVYPPPNPAFAPQPYYGGQHAMPPNLDVAPVMFHAPAGPAAVTGEINMNEISPATPLLTPSQPEVSLLSCS